MSYHEDVKKKNILLLRDKMKDLPEFCNDFLRSIIDTTSSRTQLGYSRDLRIFLQFLINEQKDFNADSVRNFPLEDLRKIQASDISAYMEYLGYYIQETEQGQREYTNGEKGKSRKLSALRSFFLYLFKYKIIDSNPAEIIDFPKIHRKNIVRLEINEIVDFLDEVETGENLTDRQSKYHSKTMVRDLAITTLLLGTGMRISECVGIDLKDLELTENRVKVTRKGGNEAILYFSDEVLNCLKDYILIREKITTLDGHEDALFLSMQNRRITDRAVQKLVKKYSQTSVALKNISPHKLRSTFATNLYRETGDLYLVAEVLGHENVNTTKLYYAEADKEAQRRAVMNYKLRED